MALLRRYRGRLRRGSVWIGAVGLALFCALVAVPQPASEGDNEFSEYDIKAAFLVNFAKYVEWPEEAFPEPDSPFKIGILGANPFGDTLARLAGGQKLDGRKMVVEQSDDVKELLTCQIVFIPGTDRKSTPADLEALKKLPVLTVGEQEGFVVKGGIINFVVVETKIKFEINVKIADQADLKVSPRLLKLAVVRHE